MAEDFTTYTEVDPSNHLTVTTSKAEGADVDQDEDVYLYDDKGVDHFDALDIDFEIYIASSSVAGGRGGPAVTNTIGAMPDFVDTDVESQISKHAANYRIRLLRGTAASDIYVCSADTLYYCTFERAAGNDTASLKIYSDSGRETLLDTLALAGFGTVKWRYVYGFQNWNTTVGGIHFDGYVQNLDLAPITAKTSSDTGSGVGAHIALAPQSAGDTGSGAGTHIAVGLSGSDYGYVGTLQEG